VEIGCECVCVCVWGGGWLTNNSQYFCNSERNHKWSSITAKHPVDSPSSAADNYDAFIRLPVLLPTVINPFWREREDNMTDGILLVLISSHFDCGDPSIPPRGPYVLHSEEEEECSEGAMETRQLPVASFATQCQTRKDAHRLRHCWPAMPRQFILEKHF